MKMQTSWIRKEKTLELELSFLKPIKKNSKTFVEINKEIIKGK